MANLYLAPVPTRNWSFCSNYPITINIYNSTNQIASSVSIANDQMFFDFFKNLTDSQYFALNYPVQITDNKNHVTSIANNSQFENAIKYALDNCSENINTSLDFQQILTTNFLENILFF